MGFFSPPPKSETSLHECNLCGKSYAAENFAEQYDICQICLLRAASFLENYMQPLVTEFHKLANEASDPDEKITHLTSLLGVLYEYKVKYEDNDVHLVESDIQDDIDQIIYAISMIRI